LANQQSILGVDVKSVLRCSLLSSWHFRSSARTIVEVQRTSPSFQLHRTTNRKAPIVLGPCSGHIISEDSLPFLFLGSMTDEYTAIHEHIRCRQACSNCAIQHGGDVFRITLQRFFPTLVTGWAFIDSLCNSLYAGVV
jgi:hypothetical protein